MREFKFENIFRPAQKTKPNLKFSLQKNLQPNGRATRKAPEKVSGPTPLKVARFNLHFNGGFAAHIVGHLHKSEIFCLLPVYFLFGNCFLRGA